MKMRVALAGAAVAAITAVGAGGAHAAAPATPSSNGHGGYTVTDTNGRQVHRQFSFSATTKKDGTVNGSAELHNPAFDPTFSMHVDVTCLKVTGNVASFGGTVTKTSDPAFGPGGYDRAFWTVVDNGEPGTNDTISAVFFDNVVPPSACQFITPSDFPQQPIENGNVQVKP